MMMMVMVIDSFTWLWRVGVGLGHGDGPVELLRRWRRGGGTGAAVGSPLGGSGGRRGCK